MASIQEYLDLIKDAIYGKDVRQAIHDGIQQCYYDGKAGSTDLEARQRLDSAEGSINSLGSRMSTAEGDIDTLDARVDQIVAPSGEAPSAAEVADGRIVDGVTYNLIGDAIRAVNTNLNNRISGEIPVDMTDGYFISSSDGSEISNSGSSVTSLIPVNKGDKYLLDNIYVSGSRAVVAYNQGGKVETIITNSSATSVTYTVPDGVLFIRATGYSGKVVHVYKAGIAESSEKNADEIDKIKEEITDYESNSSLIKALRGQLKADRYFNSNFEKYPFPDSDFEQIGVDVFTDKRNFITNYDHSAHKNSGGTTYYLSINGRDRHDGLSKPFAKQYLTNLYASLQDGDTVVLCDGVYPRSYFPKIQKSINIVAEHNGKVFITNGDASHTFTLVEGTTYSTSRSNVKSAVVYLGNGIFTTLTEVFSVNSCKTTPLSYFSDASLCYINVAGLFVPTNENVFLNLGTGNPLCTFEPSSADINIYLEGITFIGGYSGGVIVRNTASYTFELHAYDCKFIGAYKHSSGLYDGISVLGGKAYFEKCVACFSRKDGFNYHANNNEIPLAFELDCEAYCNGIYGTDNTNNGSTIHDGGIAIRVNGAYHDNFGGNVADVHTSTKSLNLRCIAFDSKSSQTDYASDFTAQQSGATMWLDCCKAFGSDWSIYSVTGAEMHIHDSEYINTQGGGVIDTSWNPYT